MMKKCEKHPKYKGKRKPKYDCLTCLSMYMKLKTVRIPLPPNKVHKDKTKYSRKKKHKNEDS